MARSALRIHDNGDLVYSQGDPQEYIFILVSGWAAVHRDLADGRRHVVNILRPGALFGVQAAASPLNHGVTALTNVAVCPIRLKGFGELRAQFPEFNERFVVMLEQALDRAVEISTVLAQGNARERIAGVLRDLTSGSLPTSAGGARYFRVPLTQRHIAEATGLTPIHVNRVLRQLREERVVAMHKGMLEVIDPRKLELLAAPLEDGHSIVEAQVGYEAPAVALRGRHAGT